MTKFQTKGRKRKLLHPYNIQLKLKLLKVNDLNRTLMFLTIIDDNLIEVNTRVDKNTTASSIPTIVTFNHLLSITVEDDNLMTLHKDIIQAFRVVRSERSRKFLNNIN